MRETTIVIPVHNNWEFTKMCLESIHDNMVYNDIEIIIVDNGSTEEMPKEVWPYENIDFRHIKLDKNYGFPIACNRGIKEAQHDHIVIMNNDVIVTPGWLDGLYSHLKSDVGIVGVVTNYVGPGPQRVMLPSYSDKFDLYRKSEIYRQEHKGEYVYHHRVVALCILIDPYVIKKTGGFDERYSPGNYEDDDLCLQAIKLGKYPVIAKDVYVHHFGSVTHKTLGIDYVELMTRNEKKFREKWSKEYYSLIKLVNIKDSLKK